MDGLLRLALRVEALNRAVGSLAAWLCLPIVAIIVADVVFRRFFAIGSVMLQELEWHLHTVLFLFAAGLAYQRNAHVRIDVVAQQFSEWTRAWIELGGCVLLLLPYAGVVGWLSVAFVQRSWGFGEVSPDPGGLPYRWLIKATMPVAFALLFLQGLTVALGSSRWPAATPSCGRWPAARRPSRPRSTRSRNRA
jgi:TRAP-type mannitol/chloroaromatic compound transport system permease small subunit